jgi:hypothetical protein
MRPFSDRQFRDTVTFRPQTYSGTPMDGTAEADSGANLELAASVQPSHSRPPMNYYDDGQGREIFVRYFDVFTRQDPLAKGQSLVTWAGRTLTVVAPAFDQSLGQGLLYLTECEDRS